MKYILITGASSGIGLAIVKDLAGPDTTIFACARKAQDLATLSSLGENVVPISLDVTKPEELEEALRLVETRMNSVPGEFSLINNAGIAVPGPVEGLDMTDLRQQFEVNFFGVVRTTQIFLPLVKRHRGKIIMMSSISGIMSFPFLGAYCASKYALEAMTDSLRMELLDTGVKVVLIEPGPIKTPIWEKGFVNKESIITKLPAHLRAGFETPITRYADLTEKDVRTALPTTAVTDVVRACLNSSRPPERKIVVSFTTKILIRIALLLPAGLRDRELRKKYFRT
jgi:short-subunit dehydrogenase